MQHRIRIPSIGGDDEEDLEVVSLEVAAGDEVDEGDVLLTFSGAEGEGEVVAPAAGRVAELRVEEGDVVSVGDLVVILSAGEEGDADPGDSGAEP